VDLWIFFRAWNFGHHPFSRLCSLLDSHNDALTHVFPVLHTHGMAPSLDAAGIAALQKVVVALREDSAVLDAPELFFFKHLLLDWNAKIPAVRASPRPARVV